MALLSSCLSTWKTLYLTALLVILLDTGAGRSTTCTCSLAEQRVRLIVGKYVEWVCHVSSHTPQSCSSVGGVTFVQAAMSSVGR